MATIRVHTAQNVTVEYEVASLGDRIVAILLDYLVLIAWGAAWALLASALAAGGSTSREDVDYRDPAGMAGIVIVVLILAPYVFYHLLCEVFFNGQSLGKKARHIRVIRLDGTAPRLGHYLLRWLLRLIDTGLFGGLVAVLTIAINGRGQRLGDIAAGTTVVNVRPRPAFASSLASNFGDAVGYQVVFPEAARLADHDVALLRQLVQQATARRNDNVLHDTATKVKSLTGIRTDLQDLPFLQTVLRDHAHLAMSGE